MNPIAVSTKMKGARGRFQREWMNTGVKLGPVAPPGEIWVRMILRVFNNTRRKP